jgi:hypothetical protein
MQAGTGKQTLQKLHATICGTLSTRQAVDGASVQLFCLCHAAQLLEAARQVVD